MPPATPRSLERSHPPLPHPTPHHPRAKGVTDSDLARMRALLPLLAGLALPAAGSDVTFDDGRRRLVWSAQQGGCLASATLRAPDGDWGGNVLLAPVAAEAAEQRGEGSCSACAAPGTLTELFRNATALRLRSVSRCGAATLESVYAVDGGSDAVTVATVFHAGRTFAPTIPTVPIGNALSVVAQVAVGQRTQRSFSADGETTPQPRHAYASGGVTGALGLRWLSPKMTVALADSEPGNVKSPAVNISLQKHGFTPAAGERWSLRYAVTLGAGVAAPVESDGGAQTDVVLPLWLRPSVDRSHWGPGDEGRYTRLLEILPRYQDTLNSTAVAGCVARFLSFDPSTAPPFCQVFDAATAAMAFDRVGLHTRAAAVIRQLASLQLPDGGTPEQLSAAGRVQSHGQAILDVGEIVLAIWTHTATTQDASLAEELWPFVRSAVAFTAGLLNATTGWAEALRFGPLQQSAAYCSAPQGKAVNTLECGARLCALVGAELCPDGGAAYHRLARRASIPLNGLSMGGALPCGDMAQAYGFIEPLEAAVADDEYFARWYQSVWLNHTGLGGSFGATTDVYASGETSELSRSVFWSKVEVVRLWRGMTEWSWNSSTAVGVGGFVDCTACWPRVCTCWIPKPYSDRAVWAQSEALIYLTTDFRPMDAVKVRNVAVVSPIDSLATQSLSAVVMETTGLGISSVYVEYTCPSGARVRRELLLAGFVVKDEFDLAAFDGCTRVSFVLTASAANGLTARVQGTFEIVLGRSDSLKSDDDAAGWTGCPGLCFAGVCRDIGNYRNFSVAECESKCLATERCTAINSGAQGDGHAGACALRACPLGTPPSWRLRGSTGYAHYKVSCDAPPPPPPGPPTPPSPAPPSPPPRNLTKGSQVHLSLGAAPNSYVVTWSTAESLAESGGSVAELTLLPTPRGPGRMTKVAGTEEQFVDNGTLRHTQYIHRATFSGLVSGSRYMYRVACDGAVLCNESFVFVAVFRTRSEVASFTVFGDMGWWNDKAFPQLVADADRRDTDVVIHVSADAPFAVFF